LVACGAAGLGLRDARISSGCEDSDVDDGAKRPTPAGVGVNGGGLVGDADAATLRFLGSGVAGKSGTVRMDSLAAELGSSCGVVVAEALLLRFLGAADGFWILVYLATASGFALSVDVGTGVMILATRAERLRDMLKCFEWLRRVLRIAPDVILSVSDVQGRCSGHTVFQKSLLSVVGMYLMRLQDVGGS
jgi:hypothetical protein